MNTTALVSTLAGVVFATACIVVIVALVQDHKHRRRQMEFHVGDRVRNGVLGHGTVCGMEMSDGRVPVSFDAYNASTALPKHALHHAAQGPVGYDD